MEISEKAVLLPRQDLREIHTLRSEPRPKLGRRCHENPEGSGEILRNFTKARGEYETECPQCIRGPTRAALIPRFRTFRAVL